MKLARSLMDRFHGRITLGRPPGRWSPFQGVSTKPIRATSKKLQIRQLLRPIFSINHPDLSFCSGSTAYSRLNQVLIAKGYLDVIARRSGRPPAGRSDHGD